jgi:hypothetical protein
MSCEAPPTPTPEIVTSVLRTSNIGHRTSDIGHQTCPPPTAWIPGRPNQQLVEHQRTEEARASHERRARDALLALGAALRAAFANVPIPLIAVQTHFSLLEGTASPQPPHRVIDGAGIFRQVPAPSHAPRPRSSLRATRLPLGAWAARPRNTPALPASRRRSQGASPVTC